MSETMLLGVLRMPPHLLINSDLDLAQRHARYIEAANLIESQQAEIQTLKEKVRELEKKNTMFKSMIENGLGWEDMVDDTLYL